MEKLVKLDKLDWRILYELDCDATRSFSQIGKKLRVGRDVVAYRTKRLEASGVIEKYISVMDFGKIGWMVAALYVKFHHDTAELRREIADYYVGRKEVWWCFDMTPDYDFAIGWFGRDVPDIRKIQFDLLMKYRKYVRNYKLRLYTHFYHFKRNYLLPSDFGRKALPSVVDARPDRVTDETDERILSLLSENARMPYVEVARKAGLSTAQAHYRIRALRKRKILLWARTKLDLAKIGYEYFKLDIYLDDYTARQRISDYLFSLPNVIYAFDVIGGADIEADIHTMTFGEFMEIQDRLKGKFSKEISHTEYYQFKREYKQTYFPPTDWACEKQGKKKEPD